MSRRYHVAIFTNTTGRDPALGPRCLRTYRGLQAASYLFESALGPRAEHSVKAAAAVLRLVVANFVVDGCACEGGGPLDTPGGAGTVPGMS